MRSSYQTHGPLGDCLQGRHQEPQSAPPSALKSARFPTALGEPARYRVIEPPLPGRASCRECLVRLEHPLTGRLIPPPPQAQACTDPTLIQSAHPKREPRDAEDLRRDHRATKLGFPPPGRFSIKDSSVPRPRLLLLSTPRLSYRSNLAIALPFLNPRPSEGAEAK